MADRRQRGQLSRQDSGASPPRPPDVEDSQFLGVDLHELFVRLLAYAAALVRSHSWRGELPNGSSEDLVQTAFAKVVSGKRRYREGVSPFTFMAGIIRSDFSHLLEKHGRSGVAFSIASGEPEDPATIGAETVATDAPSGDTAVLIASKWIERLRETYGQDSLPIRYVELIASGRAGTAAAKLANALGITVSDIFNLNRLLRRFVKRYQANAQRGTS